MIGNCSINKVNIANGGTKLWKLLICLDSRVPNFKTLNLSTCNSADLYHSLGGITSCIVA